VDKKSDAMMKEKKKGKNSGKELPSRRMIKRERERVSERGNLLKDEKNERCNKEAE